MRNKGQHAINLDFPYWFSLYAHEKLPVLLIITKSAKL